MLAGTKDGKNWGFYFDDQKDSLKKYFELTREEHMALMDGQSTGKVITFHDDKKPTLEDPPPPTEKELAEQEIRQLKSYLSETDYVAIKIAEGAVTAEESEKYAQITEKRQQARKKINELETKIETSSE